MPRNVPQRNQALRRRHRTQLSRDKNNSRKNPVGPAGNPCTSTQPLRIMRSIETVVQPCQQVLALRSTTTYNLARSAMRAYFASNPKQLEGVINDFISTEIYKKIMRHLSPKHADKLCCIAELSYSCITGGPFKVGLDLILKYFAPAVILITLEKLETNNIRLSDTGKAALLGIAEGMFIYNSDTATDPEENQPMGYQDYTGVILTTPYNLYTHFSDQISTVFSCLTSTFSPVGRTQVALRQETCIYTSRDSEKTSPGVTLSSLEKHFVKTPELFKTMRMIEMDLEKKRWTLCIFPNSKYQIDSDMDANLSYGTPGVSVFNPNTRQAAIRLYKGFPGHDLVEQLSWLLHECFHVRNHVNLGIPNEFMISGTTNRVNVAFNQEKFFAPLGNLLEHHAFNRLLHSLKCGPDVDCLGPDAFRSSEVFDKLVRYGVPREFFPSYDSKDPLETILPNVFGDTFHVLDEINNIPRATAVQKKGFEEAVLGILNLAFTGDLNLPEKYAKDFFLGVKGYVDQTPVTTLEGYGQRFSDMVGTLHRLGQECQRLQHRQQSPNLQFYFEIKPSGYENVLNIIALTPEEEGLPSPPQRIAWHMEQKKNR